MRVNARDVLRDAEARLETVPALVREHPCKRAEVEAAVAALRRGRAVGQWAGRAGEALLLTGLPTPERPECFRTLVRLLGATARPEDAVLGSRELRAAAAAVYQRREQRDVFRELPDIVRVDELVAFSRADRAACGGWSRRPGRIIEDERARWGVA
ncbi:DNA/RNA helicase [Mycobacterium tuberculosis]|nr:DNA/RNA helicase [Mycobacterium tuberculosis]